MFFWKINDLKKLIVERGLTEAQVFYYILFYVILNTVALELMPYFAYENPNGWDYIQSGLHVSVPILGTIFAYRANGGAKGTTFAAKYFSISFVVAIRFLMYFLPLMVVLMAHYWLSFEDNGVMETEWFEVVVFSLWYVALYVSIVKHLRDTVKA